MAPDGGMPNDSMVRIDMKRDTFALLTDESLSIVASRPGKYIHSLKNRIWVKT